MKKVVISFRIAALCLAILFIFCSCDLGGIDDVDGTETNSAEIGAPEFKAEGRLYFGNDKSQALLMDDYGSLTWIYPSEEGMLEPFDTGDRVEVIHGGMMLSYPGQMNVTSVTYVSDGDESVFTDRELEEIERVIDGFR